MGWKGLSSRLSSKHSAKLFGARELSTEKKTKQSDSFRPTRRLDSPLNQPPLLAAFSFFFFCLSWIETLGLLLLLSLGFPFPVGMVSSCAVILESVVYRVAWADFFVFFSVPCSRTPSTLRAVLEQSLELRLMAPHRRQTLVKMGAMEREIRRAERALQARCILQR